MFLKYSSTLVFLNLLSLAFSAVYLSLPSVHPGFITSNNLNEPFCKCSFTDHPSKCWDNDTSKAYEIDAAFTIPECTRVTCLADLSFEYAS